MKITSGFAGREEAIIDLFTATFTVSEGEDEGTLIASLVRDLLADTPLADIRVFCAEDGSRMLGAVVFTPLNYTKDKHRVVLLSPMAVATEHQGQGIGTALITHALSALRSEEVDVAMTYGDPNFYGRVGFQPITEDQAKPPLPLSFPQGWLGQSLTDHQMPIIDGPSTCVSALNRGDVW